MDPVTSALYRIAGLIDLATKALLVGAVLILAVRFALWCLQ